MLTVYLASPLYRMDRKVHETLYATFPHFRPGQVWSGGKAVVQSGAFRPRWWLPLTVSVPHFQQAVQRRLYGWAGGACCINMEGPWIDKPSAHPEWAVSAKIGRAVVSNGRWGHYNGIRTSPFSGEVRWEPVPPEILTADCDTAYVKCYHNGDGVGDMHTFLHGSIKNNRDHTPDLDMVALVSQSTLSRPRRLLGIENNEWRDYLLMVLETRPDAIMWFSTLGGMSPDQMARYGQVLGDLTKDM